MREIKFRAMKDDMSTCEFVYGNLIYGDNGVPRIQEQNGDMTFVTCLKNTEGECTGLTDKNGVKIYEGDMVSAGNKKWIVIWHEQQSCWWLGPIVPDNTSIDEYLLTILGNGMLGNGYYTRKDLEVIGNIHQNKDLLK